MKYNVNSFWLHLVKLHVHKEPHKAVLCRLADTGQQRLSGTRQRIYFNCSSYLGPCPEQHFNTRVAGPGGLPLFASDFMFLRRFWHAQLLERFRDKVSSKISSIDIFSFIAWSVYAWPTRQNNEKTREPTFLQLLWCLIFSFSRNLTSYLTFWSCNLLVLLKVVFLNFSFYLQFSCGLLLLGTPWPEI